MMRSRVTYFSGAPPHVGGGIILPRRRSSAVGVRRDSVSDGVFRELEKATGHDAYCTVAMKRKALSTQAVGYSIYTFYFLFHTIKVTLSC
jgi:hypothetical protein